MPGSDTIPHYIPSSDRARQNGFLHQAETAHRLHGDLVWIGEASSPLLLLAGGRHVRLMIEQESLFLKDFESVTSASAVGRIIMGPALTTSLDGEEWRIARKLTTPAVNPRSPRLKEGTERSAHWLAATLSEGKPPSLRSLCLNWALMCVADGFFGSAISMVQLDRMIDHFRRIYLQLIIGAPAMSYEQMCHHPALALFRKEVRLLISPHIGCSASDQHQTTMLQRLCQALDVKASHDERERVISLLLGNLAASVDNTGIALLWTLTHLSQHQAFQHRIREEHAQGKQTTALAVVKESLRLTPVTAFFERRTAGELVIDGVTLAQGTRVVFSPWLVQRNRQYWADPLIFQPERFLTGTKIPNEHYFPFGVGKRHCVGMTLALDQLTTAIVTFCEHFAFSLAPDILPAALKPLFELNVMPRGDIRFNLHPHSKVVSNVY